MSVRPLCTTCNNDQMTASPSGSTQPSTGIASAVSVTYVSFCSNRWFVQAEAVQAYLEWAPLGRVGASGLLNACAYLLTVPTHRMGACGMLRQVSARRQLQVMILNIFI
jgi:hypothetical protein